MKSRPVLTFALGVIVLGPRPGRAADPPRPNILVVLADDLGYGDLGCYGSPVIKTPHLDRIMAGSAKLTACYAGAPNCSPSRAALLTGRHAARVGLFEILNRSSKEMQLRASELTLPELLKPAGYDTYHVGKWHLTLGRVNGKPNPDASPTRHGFDVTNADGDITAPAAAEEFIRWLGSRQPGPDGAARPFFAYLALHESHEPVVARSLAEFRKPYETPEAEAAAKTVTYGGVPRPARAAWANRNHYYSLVAQVDAAVGRLVKHLDDAKLSENTFVFFSSDNGPEHRAEGSFGSPGPLRGAKGHLLEGGIRVPGFVRWPGHIKPGVVCGEPIGLVDVLPTVCAIAGVTPPQDRPIDGVNILPALTTGQRVMRPKPLLWYFWNARGGYQYAMRDGDWKILAAATPPTAGRPLIDHIKGGKFDGFALYRVSDDIGEANELSKQEPEVFARMKKRFLELYTEVMAEAPSWDMGTYNPPAKKKGK